MSTPKSNRPNNQDKNSRLKKGLLVVCGHLFVGLGIIGIAIPLLPTTPFLLLALSCYIKSSDRFYNWLINNKILGKYIKNYHEGKGVPIKLKLISISLLWTTILLSVFIINSHILIKIILFIIATGVTIHILMIRPKSNSNQV